MDVRKGRRDGCSWWDDACETDGDFPISIHMWKDCH